MSKPEWWGDHKLRHKFFWMLGNLKASRMHMDEIFYSELLPEPIKQEALNIHNRIFELEKALADIAKGAQEVIETVEIRPKNKEG